ncbi:MAG: CotH kinase family protein, partial [Bdellovibrionales bacterium]|nr:CotH kinase family protein [Bdellovibrionales bacterium]
MMKKMWLRSLYSPLSLLWVLLLLGGALYLYPHLLSHLSLQREDLITALKGSQENLSSTKLPIFEFRIKTPYLQKLESSIPRKDDLLFYAPRQDSSLDPYVPGVFWSGFDQRTQAKFKYRGDSYYHWGKMKKSWRVKFPSDQLFDGQRRINLVSPKFESQMENFISYTYAKMAGVLAPLSYFVHARLNGKYLGLMLFVEQIDKYFMVNHALPEGKVYYLDLGGPWSEISSWESPGGIFRSQKENPDSELKTLTEVMKLRSIEDLPAFRSKIFSIIDRESFVRWAALNTVLGLYHQDSFHNIKIIFDPSKGKFIPIVWDPLMGKITQKSYFASEMILSRLVSDPEFQFQKNQMAWKLMQNELSKENQVSIVKKTIENIREDIYADSLKEYTKGSASGLRKLSNQKWDVESQKIISNVEKRFDYLSKEFMSNHIKSYHQMISKKNQSQKEFRGVLQYKGVSGIDMQLLELCSAVFSTSVSENISMRFVMGSDQKDAKTIHGKYNKEKQCFHFSYERKISPALIFTQISDHPNQPDVPLWKLSTRNIPFSVTISGAQLNDPNVLSIKFYMLNALDESKEVVVTSIYENIDQKYDLSKNETLDVEGRFINNDLVWEGDVFLKEDVLIKKDQNLILKPGTKVFLDSNVSIFVEGSLFAIGQKEAPIVFQASGNRPWGVLALHDINSNIELSYCHFKGG